MKLQMTVSSPLAERWQGFKVGLTGQNRCSGEQAYEVTSYVLFVKSEESKQSESGSTQISKSLGSIELGK